MALMDYAGAFLCLEGVGGEGRRCAFTEVNYRLRRASVELKGTGFTVI